MKLEGELLMMDWFRRVRESQRAHYVCGTRYGNFNRLLGIPTIVLSAIVGTTVFSMLNQTASTRMKVMLGGLSVAAAVLASLQTFMSFGALADRHRLTASKCGAIRRKLEMLKTFPPGDEVELRRRFEEIEKDLDDLTEHAPHVPSRLRASINAELRRKEDRTVFGTGLSAAGDVKDGRP